MTQQVMDCSLAVVRFGNCDYFWSFTTGVVIFTVETRKEMLHRLSQDRHMGLPQHRVATHSANVDSIAYVQFPLLFQMVWLLVISCGKKNNRLFTGGAKSNYR
jgi:hypothetical protein